jgi:hypothetical protein
MHVDSLTALGVVSTGAAILLYHLEPRHSLWVLAFAVASLSSAVYAFLQGAWPFGVAELFWVGVASHRYWLLWRGGARAYVPGASPHPLTVASLTMPPASPARHCRAGYPLRMLDAPASAARAYRPAPVRRAATGS